MPMEFLTPIEKNNLRKILIQVTQLQTAYDRSNFLHFCGLNQYVQCLELNDSKCRKVGDNTGFRNWLNHKLTHTHTSPPSRRVQICRTKTAGSPGNRI